MHRRVPTSLAIALVLLAVAACPAGPQGPGAGPPGATVDDATHGGRLASDSPGEAGLLALSHSDPARARR